MEMNMGDIFFILIVIAIILFVIGG